MKKLLLNVIFILNIHNNILTSAKHDMHAIQLAFLIACATNNLSTTKELLQHPTLNPNFQDEQGLTALMFACQNGHFNIVKELVNLPTLNPNIQGPQGLTALMFACQNGHTDSAIELTRHKALNPNIQETTQGFTALMIACINKRTDTVKKLVTFSTLNPNIQEHNGFTALIIACQNKLPDIVQALLQHSKLDLNLQNNNGTTALMIACKNELTDIVQALLQHSKLDLNLQNNNGTTALMFACKNELTDIVQKLLQHSRLNLNLQNNNGTAALMIACKKGNTDIVKELINLPTLNPNIQERDGFTALMIACRKGNSNIVKELVNLPTLNPNIQERDGFTALMIACANELTEDTIVQALDIIVQALLQHSKLDLNLQNKEGATALMFACQNGNTNIVKKFLQHPKLDLDLQNNKGTTALMIACQNGNTDIVTELLQHPTLDFKQKILCLNIASSLGFDSIVKLFMNDSKLCLHVKSNPICTPLIYACSNKQEKVVDELLKYSEIISTINKEFNHETALTQAAAQGNKSIVEKLIQAGANINHTNKDGNTPLMIAINHGFYQVPMIILQQPNINLSIQNHEKKSALDLALESEKIELFKIIFEQLKDKNLVNDDVTEQYATKIKSSDLRNTNQWLQVLGITTSATASPTKIPTAQSSTEEEKKRLFEEQSATASPTKTTSAQSVPSSKDSSAKQAKAKDIAQAKSSTTPAKSVKITPLERLQEIFSLNEKNSEVIRNKYNIENLLKECCVPLRQDTSKLNIVFSSFKKWPTQSINPNTFFNQFENISVDIDHIINIQPSVSYTNQNEPILNFDGGHCYATVQDYIDHKIFKIITKTINSINGCAEWKLRNTITGSIIFKTTFPEYYKPKDIISSLLKATFVKTEIDPLQQNIKNYHVTYHDKDKNITLDIKCVIKDKKDELPQLITAYPIVI